MVSTSAGQQLLLDDCFDMASHVTSVFGGLHYAQAARLCAALRRRYIIESLTRIINFAFAFVPGTIGVYEEHRDHPEKPGFAVAPVWRWLVRKAAIVSGPSSVFSSSPRARAQRRARVRDRSPRLQKTDGQSRTFKWSHIAPRARPSAWLGSSGQSCGVFTVAWRTPVARARTAARPTSREIMLGPAVRLVQRLAAFTMSAAHAGDLQHIEGVRMAVPIGQNLDRSPGHRWARTCRRNSV